MSHSLQLELTPADETALGYYLIDAAEEGFLVYMAFGVPNAMPH